MAPQLPTPRAERGQLQLLPGLARHRPRQGPASTSRARSSSSRCSNSPAPAPAAARRRTSSCMTPALRRPRAHRQRHRLLVDLRRQPAHHALLAQRRRPRPGLGQLAVRGQRRVRPGLAAGRRPAHRATPRELLQSAARRRSATTWWTDLSSADQTDEAGINAQRERVAALKQKLAGIDAAEARRCWRWPTTWSARASGSSAATAGPTTSATAAWTTSWPRGRNVNILVLDTEVYSNTGGQASKSTPIGAVAKFAAGGKAMPKKDLGMIAMTYGNVYVATVAMGANDAADRQGLPGSRELRRALAVIAYSHCIAHGIDMIQGMRAAEAGGGLRPLAALPLRPAARRARASNRSSSTAASRPAP